MPHKEDDISYLLSQISEGNSSCFEKMYKRYFKKCYSIALYFVQSTSSAEDVLSDVFLTLWHKRENLKDVKDWDSYLFITTKNHAITFLEKNRQDNLSSIDQIIIEKNVCSKLSGNCLRKPELFIVWQKKTTWAINKSVKRWIYPKGLSIHTWLQLFADWRKTCKNTLDKFGQL